MLSASKLSMCFGEKVLFKNASFQLNPGCHYGLVGANGSGKSTLIKIFCGDLTPEKGDISIPQLFRLGTLKQDHYLYENVSILNTVLMGNQSLWAAWQAKEQLLAKVDFSEVECLLLDELEEKINAQQGYSAESEAAQLLEGLGLSLTVHHQPLSTLSGGYKLRVLLAQLLFSKPDALLLDEPTNHLDIFTVQWLEGYLKNFEGLLLVSSHDRKFLNNVCDHIIDVDHETVKIYKGDYDSFLETKQFNLEQLAAQHETQEKKKERLQVFIDRFQAKASKAKQAQSKMRLVEKIEDQLEDLELVPSSRQFPVLKFDLCRLSSAISLKTQAISKAYGKKQVLKSLSFEVERGDKIAFIGPNGVGKSTLLEILTASLPACEGNYEWGFATYPVYFPQDHAKALVGDHTPLSWLAQFDTGLSEEKLRAILARVLFTGDAVHKLTGILSGGEAARLLLAKMMMVKHNVLIFDEPTNHLDMESADALCTALQEYPGTLLFVSHNRHFVAQVANRIIELTPEGLTDHRCSFEEYLQKKNHDFLNPSLKTAAKSSPVSTVKPTHHQNKNDQKKRQQVEKKIKLAEEQCAQLELKIEAHNKQLSQANFYEVTLVAQVDQLLHARQILEQELEQALRYWEQAALELQQ